MPTECSGPLLDPLSMLSLPNALLEFCVTHQLFLTQNHLYTISGRPLGVMIQWTLQHILA